MGKSQTTSTTATPWIEAQPFIKEGLNRAGSMWDRGKFHMSPWKGPYVAPESNALEAARNEIRRRTGGQVNTLERAQGQVGDVASMGVNNEQAGQFRTAINRNMDTGKSRAFDEGIRRAMMDNNDFGFERATRGATADPMGFGLRGRVAQNVAESVMPHVNAAFGTSGMAGSGLHAAAAAKGMTSAMAPIELDAANRSIDRSLQAGAMRQGALEGYRDRSMQAGMVDNAARETILNRNLNAGMASQGAMMDNREQALRAAGMAPAMAEATYAPLDRMEQVGQDRTEANQQRLNARILADAQKQSAPIDALNNYMALVGGTGAQFGTTASTASSNPGLLGILGGGLQGAGLLASLAGSDRRIKANIKRVGQMDSGVPIYTYTYKGGKTPHMGVMAQDLEKVMPEAVVEISGVKLVNYGVL